MTKLKLLRHGQSMANMEHPGVFSDHHNYLTRKGLNQAIEAGEQLLDEGFVPDIVWSSTMPRAYQTTMTVLSMMDLPIEVGLSEHLIEMNWEPSGRFVTETEMSKLFGVDHVDKVKGTLDQKAWPGGENQLDVYNRVIPFFRKVIEPDIINGKKVLIVCHYYVIRALISYIETGSPEIMPENKPKNCVPYSFY